MYQDAAPTRHASVMRWGFGITGGMILLVVWLEFLFVRHEVLLGFLLIAVLAAAAVLARFSSPGRAGRAIQLLAAVGIAAQILWLILSWYPLWVIPQAAAVVLAFICFFQVWRLRRGDRVTGARRIGRGIARVGAGMLAIIAAALSIAVVTNAITPAPLTSAIQSSLGYGNSFEPLGPEQERTVTDGGALRISDISYGTQHPNSHLDVYIADNDPTIARPTYVYLHGGGWIVGGKASGDPAAGASGAFNVISDPMLEAGYNVVSIDYALAPDASYPTPVIQLSQAIAFLQEHGSDYGLTMDDVVIAGASAGGQLIGQFANIQTNPVYANQIGIDPVMDSNLEAVVFDSAALDMDLVGTSQSPVASADWLYTIAQRTYLGTPDARAWAEADVTDHVTANFPATFIADGNKGTFPDQARNLHNKLDELGVPNALNLYATSDAVLGHGFMASPSPWTDDYNEQKLEFLATSVK